VQLSGGTVPVTLAASLTMAEQKTSAYSFALPLQAGAVLAGAEERTVAQLGEAGRELGVAFQLVDDLIGVFGDPRIIGKSVTSDLRSAKQTPLLVHASSTPEWEEVRTYVGRDLRDGELDEVRRLLTAAGSRRFVEELAESHVAAARAAFEELGVSPDLVAAATPRLPVLVDRDGVAA
jgi:geranylgeranyl diphosphate synthase type II